MYFSCLETFSYCKQIWRRHKKAALSHWVISHSGPLNSSLCEQTLQYSSGRGRRRRRVGPLAQLGPSGVIMSGCYWIKTPQWCYELSSGRIWKDKSRCLLGRLEEKNISTNHTVALSGGHFLKVVNGKLPFLLTLFRWRLMACKNAETTELTESGKLKKFKDWAEEDVAEGMWTLHKVTQTGRRSWGSACHLAWVIFVKGDPHAKRKTKGTHCSGLLITFTCLFLFVVAISCRSEVHSLKYVIKSETVSTIMLPLLG